MKNYIIGLLAVIVLLFGSIVYRDSKNQVLMVFPVPQNTEHNEAQVPLHLVLFFSKKNCLDCMQMIRVLNEMKDPFFVTGIVPDDELDEIEQLRDRTKALFPLYPLTRKYHKLMPIMWPSLYGVSRKGAVLFILPGVPGVEGFLQKYLNNLFVSSKGVLLSN